MSDLTIGDDILNKAQARSTVDVVLRGDESAAGVLLGSYYEALEEIKVLRAENEQLREALREILRGKVDEIERDDEGHIDGGFVRPMQMYEAQRIARTALAPKSVPGGPLSDAELREALPPDEYELAERGEK